MAPDLAGFVTDSDDSRSSADIVAAALEAVRAEFGVTPESATDLPGVTSAKTAPGKAGTPAPERRATWLDTFDWRLHKAGLTLEYLPGRGDSELRLSGRDGEEARQPVTGWTPSRPHLIADLEGGPVGERLAKVIEMRALLPVVSTSTATSTYRLLNRDDKTVARLSVEQWSATAPHPGKPPGALPARLSISPVRGYTAQARRAARLLAAVPGIVSRDDQQAAASPAAAAPLTAAPLTAALRAIGRTPGDYSSKVITDISADMPAAAAAAAVSLRLLDTADANLDGVLADVDSEYLHDLRVAVRRTRSALKLFGDALDGLSADDLAFFAAEFKWVGDLTTPVRDLDVHLLGFDDMARSLAAAQPGDLEPLRAFLERRRRTEVRLLARGLRSPRYAALTQEWRARLLKIAQGTVPAGGNTARPRARFRASGETAGMLAAERTRVAFAKVAKRGAAISPKSPPESLHDLRKRCKELRYALEFFAPLHDPVPYGKVLSDLKRLQDCLGEFQDTQVQAGEIRTLAVAMLEAGEAPAATLLAMGEVTGGLAARQQAARADFERKFAGFADVAGRRRMAELLRGGIG